MASAPSAPRLARPRSTDLREPPAPTPRRGTLSDYVASQAMHPRGLWGRVEFIFMNSRWGHRSIYEHVARVLDLRPDDDLLEVACGNGYFLKTYAPHVRSVAGLDLAPLSVELAAKNNAERVAAGTAEFVLGDAADLPWGDGTFSATTSMGSFIGFPKPLEALKEMHRVLRPGGRAVVGIEWNAEDGKDHSREARQYGFHIWTEEQVRTMFRKAGFSDVSITYGKGIDMPRMMAARAAK